MSDPSLHVYILLKKFSLNFTFYVTHIYNSLIDFDSYLFKKDDFWS